MHQLRQPDPRGWLTFTNMPDDDRAAEDATLFADYQRIKQSHHLGQALISQHSAQDGHRLPCFQRDATTTEKKLLQHLGHTIPDELKTCVHYRAEGVRFRFWPQLEQASTEGETDA